MLNVVKDYITWGEISSELKLEIEKTKTEKGKEGKSNRFYRLHPPRGGFERNGIKQPFSKELHPLSWHHSLE